MGQQPSPEFVCRRARNPRSWKSLVEGGWNDLPTHEALLDEAARLSAKGNGRAYILKRLNRIHPRHESTIAMRKEPLAFAEVVEATTKDDEKTFNAARRTMTLSV
jgi:hypothetical protein